MTDRPAGAGVCWAVGALFFLATRIDYLDRQVPGHAEPTLRRDLGRTEIDDGRVVSWFTISCWETTFGIRSQSRPRGSQPRSLAAAV